MRETIGAMANSALPMAIAKIDARDHGLKKGHGGHGMVKCPGCPSGLIRYSVETVNGHMWGRCSTKDCAKFME